MKNGEGRPEDALRAKLEGFRARLFVKYGEKGAKRILIGVPVAILVLLLLIAAFFLIPIRGIEVSGDVTMFNEGEIIDAAEIDEGDSIFLRSSGSIKRRIMKNLPLAESVKVRKTITGIVKIDIEFGDVDFYTEIDGKYYALSEDLRVLDVSESRAKYSAYGAALVIIPEVREPVVGEKLVFYDTVEETDTEGETLYEVKEERFYAYVSDFLSALKDSGFSEQTDGVILYEKFAITVIYDMKYKVNFGNVSDLSSKFNILFEILNDEAMKSMEKVYVDLSTPSKSTARPDNSLDFSIFDD